MTVSVGFPALPGLTFCTEIYKFNPETEDWEQIGQMGVANEAHVTATVPSPESYCIN